MIKVINSKRNYLKEDMKSDLIDLGFEVDAFGDCTKTCKLNKDITVSFEYERNSSTVILRCANLTVLRRRTININNEEEFIDLYKECQSSDSITFITRLIQDYLPTWKILGAGVFQTPQWKNKWSLSGNGLTLDIDSTYYYIIDLNDNEEQIILNGIID